MLVARRDLMMGAAASALAVRAKPSLAKADDYAALSEALVRTAPLAGLGVAVARSGGPLYVAGHGRASLTHDVPATERTLFHVASVGKSITAYLVVQLADRGEIDLDRPIGTYLGDFPKTWLTATVRHYLTHTSGLSDYDDGPEFEFDRPMEMARKIAVTGEPIAAPGEGYYYSGMGYILLGALIERITRRSYGAATTELFAQLRMPDARLDTAGDVVPGRAEPVVQRDGVWRHATRMESAISSTADGGVLLSPRDMAVWLQEMLAPTLVSPRAAAAMFEPMPLTSGRAYPYGLGWELDLLRGRSLANHSGLVPGFVSGALLARGAGASVFFSTNCRPHSLWATYDYAARMLERAAPGTTPVALEPIPDRAPERTAMARTVLNWKTNADVDDGLLAPELHPRKGKLDTFKPFGIDEAKELTLLEEFRFCGCTVRRFKVASTPGRTWPVSFAHASDGRIAWML